MIDVNGGWGKDCRVFGEHMLDVPGLKLVSLEREGDIVVASYGSWG